MKKMEFVISKETQKPTSGRLLLWILRLREKERAELWRYSRERKDEVLSKEGERKVRLELNQGKSYHQMQIERRTKKVLQKDTERFLDLLTTIFPAFILATKMIRINESEKEVKP